MKKSPHAHIAKKFAISCKAQESAQILTLLQENPDFVLENNSFLTGNSFNFGKNCAKTPALCEYIPRIGLDKVSALKGMIYQRKWLKRPAYPEPNYPVYQETASTHPSPQVDTSSLEVSIPPLQTPPLISDLAFYELFLGLIKPNQLSTTEKQEAVSYFFNHTSFNEENLSFFIDYANHHNPDTALLEKMLQKMVRSSQSHLLHQFLEKTDIDINTSYASYNSTVAHFYFFYKTQLEEGFLNILHNKKFNPNTLNSFGESPLYVLLEQNKIEMGLEFLKTFQATLDVDMKFKGKTYLHKIILMIEASSFDAQNPHSVHYHKQKKQIEFFEQLIHFSPTIHIRSGAKGKGTTAISYLEKKISNKDLAEALKSKILLELSFGSGVKKEDNMPQPMENTTVSSEVVRKKFKI